MTAWFTSPTTGMLEMPLLNASRSHEPPFHILSPANALIAGRTEPRRLGSGRSRSRRVVRAQPERVEAHDRVFWRCAVDEAHPRPVEYLPCAPMFGRFDEDIT
jgi:hypothetical protein